jgi:hypothetical protein
VQLTYFLGDIAMFGKLISGARARSLVDGATKAVLIDLSDPVSFRDHKIAGSVNVPLRRISSISQYPKNNTIILMGDQNDPQVLTAALAYVAGYGYTKLFYLNSREDYHR